MAKGKSSDSEGTAPQEGRPGTGAGPDVLLLNPSVAIAEAEAGEAVILALADLMPDASGEVVLFTEPDVPVNLLCDAALADFGVAAAHVTATGLDVTGLNYYAFEGGITIYSPADLLIIDQNAAG